jgi:hypothetical protein
MTTPAYPLHIRSILRTGKSRTQAAAFRVSEPKRGFAYAQATGTDVPVFWDVKFRFSEAEAIVFQLWFVKTINRGILEFTMPIRTEFGLITHTCRFLPDSLLPCNEDGPIFEYGATIMARAQIIPDAYDDAADLIVTLPDWKTWASMLDQAITEEVPA